MSHHHRPISHQNQIQNIEPLFVHDLHNNVMKSEAKTTQVFCLY